MLHCDLRVRWKVASNLRFRDAISEPKTPSFCGISGDLAPSTRRSLAIAIVRFWCAKSCFEFIRIRITLQLLFQIKYMIIEKRGVDTCARSPGSQDMSYECAGDCCTVFWVRPVYLSESFFLRSGSRQTFLSTSPGVVWCCFAPPSDDVQSFSSCIKLATI